VRGRLVDVGDVNGELLVGGQPATIRAADADEIRVSRLEVEAGGGFQVAAAVDRERGVVGIARSADQHIGERVAAVRVGGAEGADDSAGRLVLLHTSVGEADVGGSVVVVRDGAVNRHNPFVVGVPEAAPEVDVAGRRLHHGGGVD